MEQVRYTLDDLLLKTGFIRGLMLNTIKGKYELNPPEIELLNIIYDLGRNRRSEIQTSEILSIYKFSFQYILPFVTKLKKEKPPHYTE